MHPLRPVYLVILFAFGLKVLTNPALAKADTSHEHLMNLTILGAIGSLGYACYLGKAPCTLDPGINSDQLTFSTDLGADNSVHHLRFALGADWQEILFKRKNVSIDGRWEVNANLWQSTEEHPENKEGWIIGLTPVFHYNYHLNTTTPYFELGGGPQLLSDIVIEDEYKSTQVQFGSILGFGLSTKQFEVGYRYLHISNANIELPNPGTDFHNLHLAYKF